MKRYFTTVLLMLFPIPVMSASAFSVNIGPSRGRYYHSRRYHHPRRYNRHYGRYYYGSDTRIISEDRLLAESPIWDTDSEGGQTVVKLENGMIFRVYVPDRGLRGYWAAIYQSESGYKLVINGRVLYADRLN